MKKILIVLSITCVLIFVLGAKNINEYNNSLTGIIQFTDWSEEVNGLQCRLGANDLRFMLGNRTPIVVLQFKNITSKPIAINDLLLPHMLVHINPADKTYYNYDFQWIYDESRKTLPAGASIEAACRIPAKLLHPSGEYELKVSINCGVYPPNTHGTPFRGKDWWTGIIETNSLKITMHE